MMPFASLRTFLCCLVSLSDTLFRNNLNEVVAGGFCCRSLHVVYRNAQVLPYQKIYRSMVSNLYSIASWYVAEDSDEGGTTIARSAQNIRMRQVLQHCAFVAHCGGPIVPPPPSSKVASVAPPPRRNVQISPSPVEISSAQMKMIPGRKLMDVIPQRKIALECKDVNKQGTCFPSNRVKELLNATIAACKERNPDDALVTERLLSVGVPFEEIECGLCFSKLPQDDVIKPLPDGRTISEFALSRQTAAVCRGSSCC